MDLPKRVFCFFLSFNPPFVCRYVWRWWDYVWFCYWSIRHLVPFWKSIENSKISKISIEIYWSISFSSIFFILHEKIQWEHPLHLGIVHPWHGAKSCQSEHLLAFGMRQVWESLWNHYGSRAQLASFFRTGGCVTVWGTSPPWVDSGFPWSHRSPCWDAHGSQFRETDVRCWSFPGSNKIIEDSTIL